MSLLTWLFGGTEPAQPMTGSGKTFEKIVPPTYTFKTHDPKLAEQARARQRAAQDLRAKARALESGLK